MTIQQADFDRKERIAAGSRARQSGEMKHEMDFSDWGLLFLLSLLWGGSFLFNALALRELSPLTVVLGRTGIASLVLLALIAATRVRMPLSLALWSQFFVMGFLNNLVPFGLIVWGQTRIDSGLASVLNATTPLFTVLIAHVWTRGERMDARRLASVLLGFSGVVVLIGPGVLAGLGWTDAAQIAVLAAAVSYACAGIYGRRFRALPVTAAAAGMLTATTAMVLPLALLLEEPWQTEPSAETWSALVALAVLSTAAAYLIYFRILARAGATNLLLVTFLIPVSAMGLGMLVLSERPGAYHIAGATLIFAGLAVVDGRVSRVFARKRAAPTSGTD